MDKFVKDIYNHHFTIKKNYSKSHTLYNSDSLTKPHIKKKLDNTAYWTHINYNTFLLAIKELVNSNPNKDFYTKVDKIMG